MKPFGSTYVEVICAGSGIQRDVFFAKDFPKGVEIIVSKEAARFGLEVVVGGPGKTVKVISY